MKVSIIGAGNMGGAIASALSEANEYDVFIYDSDKEKAESLAKEGSITALKNLEDANDSEILIIAVKPQVLPSLYDSLSKVKTTYYISIAAGVPLSILEAKLKSDKVVRFMPNIAAKNKKAVTAVALGSGIKDGKIALDIASSFGSAFLLEENLFPAFIGISGSAIAYIFDFAHFLAMGGVKEGIAYNKSLDIVTSTLLSASTLLKESGKNAIELETMVCSAAGTTIEGVEALQQGAFGATIMDAVSRASEKSRDLEKNA